MYFNFPYFPTPIFWLENYFNKEKTISEILVVITKKYVNDLTMNPSQLLKPKKRLRSPARMASVRKLHVSELIGFVSYRKNPAAAIIRLDTANVKS